MASNRVYVDGTNLLLPVQVGSVSGSPVVASVDLTGVALTTRDAAGFATVTTQGAFRLVVTGAVAAIGQSIYYGADVDPSLRLNTDATDRSFFGYALAEKTTAAAAIPVLLK